jgi:hypothetical protein
MAADLNDVLDSLDTLGTLDTLDSADSPCASTRFILSGRSAGGPIVRLAASCHEGRLVRAEDSAHYVPLTDTDLVVAEIGRLATTD